MKKFFLQTAILASLVFGFSVNTQAKEESDIYRFGLTSGWVNYLEPGYISFYGLMYGVEGLGQWNFKSRFDLRVEGGLLYGNIQYDGSVIDTNTSVVSPLKAGAYDYMLILRVKPEVLVGSAGPIDFYLNAGLGTRYLNDRVNSTSGYQREVSYVFLPLGFRLETNNGTNVMFGFDFEYDYFVVGQVKSHLSDTNPSNPDVTNTQSSGYGIRAQFETRFLTSSMFFMGIIPYFQWWNVGASDAQPYTPGKVLVEPLNSSSTLGLTIDFGF